MDMKIGIIGGTGQIGQWFKRFFEENGHEVFEAVDGEMGLASAE